MQALSVDLVSACADQKVVGDHNGLEPLQPQLNKSCKAHFCDPTLFACTDQNAVCDTNGQDSLTSHVMKELHGSLCHPTLSHML